MTIPGLSCFYAGIVKRKNMLSVLMQCFSLTCLMTLLWYAVGYSLSFSSAGNSVIGGLDKVFLAGITKVGGGLCKYKCCLSHRALMLASTPHAEAEVAL
jgi:ammonia channel protein AmtB